MLKFTEDSLEFLMDGETYNKSFKALLKCVSNISIDIEIVNTQHELIKKYPALKVKINNIYPLYEDIFDKFFVFIAKDDGNKSHIFVAKLGNYFLGFEKYRVLVYSQEEYGYDEKDVIEEIIEGGNENIYKLLQAIIAEHSLQMEVTV